MKKRRAVYLIAAAVVIVLGLASRRYSRSLPDIAALYAGDTLWAATAYLCVRFLFPRRTIWQAAAAAMLFSFSIEVSQLYHSPWIDAVRRTTPGALVLGSGFMWSDLLCYACGVCGAAVAESAMRRPGRD